VGSFCFAGWLVRLGVARDLQCMGYIIKQRLYYWPCFSCFLAILWLHRLNLSIHVMGVSGGASELDVVFYDAGGFLGAVLR
jgi:hypothetical protein